MRLRRDNNFTMRISRFYCGAIPQDAVSIEGEQFRHLLKVLRLGAGDEVELFDGRGTVASAVITEIAKTSAQVRIQQRRNCQFRTVGRIIIAAGLAKGSRFDWLISKCTELGVDRIVPVIFERTVKLAGGPRVIERYNKLAVEAAKQCGRIFLPKIEEACSLVECIKNLKKDYHNGQLLFGSLAEDAKSIIDCDTADNDVIALVGPEGGMTGREEKLLADNGATGVRLTETILRIETAALAFAAILTAKRNFIDE